MSALLCPVCRLRHLTRIDMAGIGCLASALAEIKRLTNKTTDLRADLHRIRKERDDWRAKAETRSPSSGDAE